MPYGTNAWAIMAQLTHGCLAMPYGTNAWVIMAQLTHGCLAMPYGTNAWVIMAQIMVYRLFGIRSLAKPMLVYWTVSETLIQYKHFHSRKCIWKCHLHNAGDFNVLPCANSQHPSLRWHMLLVSIIILFLPYQVNCVSCHFRWWLTINRGLFC